MAITKSKPRKRSHAEMKGAESSSENSPNKQPSPSKRFAEEKQPPAKRLTWSSSRFKTKPMTKDEGSAIDILEDSKKKNSKEVDSEAVVSKLLTTALDVLVAVAGAQVQTSETTSDEDEEVDMTKVKRRTMYTKKLKAKKKKKQTKEVEVAEDTEVEGISPPKRITRQGAQSMAQPEDRLMRLTNNPRPLSIIEAVEEMKNTILGEVQKATARLKKTFKARTDKLNGKINGLQAEVSVLKEESEVAGV
ncbi:hypothetical protein L6452_35894 [Arctium lappa]|uniref:Uncharacterized protein n=1 Tax=Arctium lappa TaxID=4217 RepID=A0ACB8Y8F7_ARCLA|nr:hypothetical protein L6452_35894 [Arctium lappa]